MVSRTQKKVVKMNPIGGIAKTRQRASLALLAVNVLHFVIKRANRTKAEAKQNRFVIQKRIWTTRPLATALTMRYPKKGKPQRQKNAVHVPSNQGRLTRGIE